ncbi:MAG: hypothetical protein HC883_03290 [Bdellovibrionaceae bacterium]|nr:hypothetical protein [Pseudobdellovibrionaceae bacterium]
MLNKAGALQAEKISLESSGAGAVSVPLSGRLGIFAPRTEFAMVLIPCMVLCLLPLELVGGFSLSGMAKRWARFVTDAVLLGTIHSVLSYTMMMFIPEMRDWMRELGNGSLTRFLTRFFLVAGVIYVFMYAAVTKWGSDIPFFVGVLTFVNVTFGVRHWVRQSQGFSLTYNWRLRSNLNYSAAETQILGRNEKLEKRLFTVLTYSTVAAGFVSSSELLEFETGLNNPQLMVFFIGIAVLSAFILVFLAFRTPQVERSNKVYYSLRYLLVPLHGISIIANLGMRAIHGIEFLFLTVQMTRNSRISRRSVYWLAISSLVFVLFAALCTMTKGAIFGALFRRQYSEYKGWITFLATLNATFTYMHYYSDALMFRMRNEPTRKLIGPLILPPQTSISPVFATDRSQAG